LQDRLEDRAYPVIEIGVSVSPIVLVDREEGGDLTAHKRFGTKTSTTEARGESCPGVPREKIYQRRKSWPQKPALGFRCGLVW
jgi:hypothetical protein